MNNYKQGVEVIKSNKVEYLKPHNLVVSIQQHIIEQIKNERWKQGDRIDELLIVEELEVREIVSGKP